MVYHKTQNDRWAEAGLSDEDFRLIRGMRQADGQLLMNLSAKKLGGRELIVCCTCVNQGPLLARHLELRQTHDLPRIITFEHGALALSEKAARNRSERRKVRSRLNTILKTALDPDDDFQRISLYVDLPCPHMAQRPTEHRLNSAQYLEGLTGAKNALKECTGAVKVGCFAFVDYEKKRGKTNPRDQKNYITTCAAWEDRKKVWGIREISLVKPFPIERLFEGKV